MSLLIFVGILVLLGLAWILWIWLGRLRRARLYRRPFKTQWRQIVERNVPLYNRLPEDLKPLLHGHINYFLEDKKFIGCSGLVITDDIRLTVAANACLLVLKRNKTIFPGFKTILVYPDTYVAREVRYEGLVEIHSDSVRSGESWHRGPVVLSWADITKATHGSSNSHNLVLHEFAHKLDEENSLMDGLPILRDSSHYSEWAKVLSREYDHFLHRVESCDNDIIDEYGAESAAEFFAVISESFFEHPTPFKERLPQLYGQLARYYDLDPAAWRRH